MYEITSNLDEIRQKLARAMRAASVMAGTADEELSGIMRSGIQSHFNRLSPGGGTDPSALGPGTGATTVRWTVARHVYTIASHAKLAVDPRQLLVLTGSLRDAITTNARISGSATADHATMTLGASNSADEEKLRRNLGGTYETDFPHIKRYHVTVKFPERQVLYWDALMRDRLLKLAIRNSEKEWTS